MLGSITGTEHTVAVDGIIDAVEVSVGTAHACARLENKTVRWGLNSNGQLGNDTTTSSSVPVTVGKEGERLTDAEEISTGIAHSCARLTGSFRANGPGLTTTRACAAIYANYPRVTRLHCGRPLPVLTVLRR